MTPESSSNQDSRSWAAKSTAKESDQVQNSESAAGDQETPEPEDHKSPEDAYNDSVCSQPFLEHVRSCKL